VPESFYEKYQMAPFRFEVDDFMSKIGYEQQVQLINKFAFMPLKGPVSMKGAELTFTLHCDATTGNYYLGRLIGIGRRDLMDGFNLKKRSYLGTTSMDAELSLVMCNLAKVGAGSLVYDPFVGTGSFLCTSASFGAFVLGSDIDGRQMRGSEGRNISSNMEQYGVSNRLADVLVFDILQHPWRDGFMVDAIITDPPYGVRAGAKKIGLKKSWMPACKFLSPEEKAVRYPKTVPYEMDELAEDLHNFALKFLRPNGRLVYWYPIEDMNDEGQRLDEAELRAILPDIEGISLVNVILQKCRQFDRWLVVFERTG
jgi:tRNA (guanine10-N2)-methyltransferase